VSDRGDPAALYVYGVVRAAARPELPTGIAGAPVRRVEHGQLAALVSELSGPVQARRRHLIAHMAVLEAGLAGGDLLPFQFGTVVVDEPSLHEHLAQREAEYLRRLDELDGMVQLTVIARHDEEAAIRDLVQGNPRLGRQARVRSTAGRIEAGRGIAAGLAALRDQDAADLARAIRPHVRELRVRGGDDVVARLAVLVPRERVDEVSDVVEQQTTLVGTRLQVELAGPSPVYDFAAG
jgi:hypothetical protein